MPQSLIETPGIKVHSYICNICPGCPCTKDVRVIGNNEPKIRQICSQYPNMDGHTTWVKA